MKKQFIPFIRSEKAGWLTSIFSLLLTALTAQGGVQRYTDSDAQHYYDVEVPSGYDYVYLLAKGADGGKIGSTNIWGGEGVRISGFVPVGNGAGQIPEGSTLRLIPGQAGGNGTHCGGGGGGTGIAFRSPAANANWILLMVAGGGGGPGGTGSHHKTGKEGSTNEFGQAGRNYRNDSMENGGSGGSGGKHSGSQAYPGGGAFSDGEGGCPGRAGYQNFEPVGGAGASQSCVEAADGSSDGSSGRGGFGFGGGGGGVYVPGGGSSNIDGGGGGGGGGYSGGGGGYSGAHVYAGDKYDGPGGGGGSYANKDYIQVLSMQGFTISPGNDGYARYYFLHSPSVQLARMPTKCLDPGGTSNEANVLINTCNDGTTQRWLVAGSTLRLAAAPDKCLDLIHSNTANGTNLQLWDCNGTNAQNWIYDVANQAIRSKIDIDKCVDLRNNRTADRTNIQIYDCVTTTAQQWLIDGTPSALPDGTTRNQRIHLVMAPDKCLDIQDAGTDDGTNIRLYDCQTSDDSQYWTFDGRQIKMQGNDSKCLDADHGNLNDFNNGTNIQLWKCNGTSSQSWIYDGFTKTFRSADAPNKCLDVDHSKLTNGTNIHIWDCNGSGAQQFEIY